MSRKRWTPRTDITPGIIKARDKKKWQIALRRYLIDQLPSTFYAPYFALDIKTLRSWFEIQFTEGINWDNFAMNWQIEHYIPVTYFDFTKPEDLRLCWNFANLRVEIVESNKGKSPGVGILGARAYFQELSEMTNYLPARQLLEKTREIERKFRISPEKQAYFIKKKAIHLATLEKYTEFEFELLNKGRTIEEINAELEQMKKIKF